MLQVQIGASIKTQHQLRNGGLWICESPLRILAANPMTTVQELLSLCRGAYPEVACKSAQEVLLTGEPVSTSLDRVCGPMNPSTLGKVGAVGTLKKRARDGTSELPHSQLEELILHGKFAWEKEHGTNSSGIDAAADAIRAQVFNSKLASDKTVQARAMEITNATSANSTAGNQAASLGGATGLTGTIMGASQSGTNNVLQKEPTVCAGYGEFCSCTGGTIYYGRKYASYFSWSELDFTGMQAYTYQTRQSSDPLLCDNSVFGTILLGFDKRCWCQQP